MCQCASVPVCQCASVPVCESVPVCQCARVCQCASVPVCQCASVPVCQCATTYMYLSHTLHLPLTLEQRLNSLHEVKCERQPAKVTSHPSLQRQTIEGGTKFKDSYHHHTHTYELCKLQPLQQTKMLYCLCCLTANG